MQSSVLDPPQVETVINTFVHEMSLIQGYESCIHENVVVVTIYLAGACLHIYYPL